MATTELHLNGLPGMPHTFVAKTEAVGGSAGAIEAIRVRDDTRLTVGVGGAKVRVRSDLNIAVEI